MKTVNADVLRRAAEAIDDHGFGLTTEVHVTLHPDETHFVVDAWGKRVPGPVEHLSFVLDA